MSKRVFAILLAMAMLISVVPMGALAASNEFPTHSWTNGDYTWSIVSGVPVVNTNNGQTPSYGSVTSSSQVNNSNCHHTYSLQTIVHTPNCQCTGAYYPKCSQCGYTNYFVTPTIIPKDMNNHAENCTCVFPCSHSYTGQFIQVTPDCMYTGTAYPQCVLCGDVNYNAAATTLDKDPDNHNPYCSCVKPCNHSYTAQFIQTYPDCMYTGVAYPQCALCGAPDYSAAPITLDKDPSNHNPYCTCDQECQHEYSAVFIQVYPDCMNTGVAYPQCAICAAPDYTAEPIILLSNPSNHNPNCDCFGCDHNYSEQFIQTYPDCMYTGVAYPQCADCGDIDYTAESILLDIDPDNHNPYCDCVIIPETCSDACGRTLAIEYPADCHNRAEKVYTCPHHGQVSEFFGEIDPSNHAAGCDCVIIPETCSDACGRTLAIEYPADCKNKAEKVYTCPHHGQVSEYFGEINPNNHAAGCDCVIIPETCSDACGRTLAIEYPADCKNKAEKVYTCPHHGQVSEYFGEINPSNHAVGCDCVIIPETCSDACGRTLIAEFDADCHNKAEKLYTCPHHGQVSEYFGEIDPNNHATGCDCVKEEEDPQSPTPGGFYPDDDFLEDLFDDIFGGLFDDLFGGFFGGFFG